MEYISNLLHQFDLAEVKPVNTPLYSKLDWNSMDTQLLDDPSLYQKIVESSQFLHQPHLIHHKIVK